MSTRTLKPKTFTSLRIQDPYFQHNLHPLKKLQSLPDRIAVVNCYEFHQEVFCHICGRKLNFEGFTGETPDGMLFLFGFDCAEKEKERLGLYSALRDFRIRDDEAYAEAKIASVRNHIKFAAHWLEQNGREVRDLSDRWKKLGEAKVLISNTLKREDGKLYEFKEIKLIEHERRNGRQYTTQRILVAELPHSDIVDKLSSLHITLDSIENYISRVLQRQASASQLVDIANDYDFVLREAHKIDAAIEFWKTFLNDPTLIQICDWESKASGQKSKYRIYREYFPKNLPFPSIGLVNAFRSNDLASALRKLKPKIMRQKRKKVWRAA